MTDPERIEANDIGMCVGVVHYPWPQSFSDEARVHGVSKIVPRNSFPHVDPGNTLLFLAHPRAIVRVGAEDFDLHDLAMELINEYVAGTDLEPPPEIKLELVRRWIGTDGELVDWELAYIQEKLIFYEDIEPRSMLGMCRLLEIAEEAKDLDRMVEKYGITFHLGWFGYTYLTHTTYEMPDDEDKVPVDLRAAGVIGIRSVYGDEEAKHGPDLYQDNGG